MARFLSRCRGFASPISRENLPKKLEACLVGGLVHRFVTVFLTRCDMH